MNLESASKKDAVRKGCLGSSQRISKCCPFPKCQGKEPLAREERKGAPWLKGTEGAGAGFTYNCFFPLKGFTGSLAVSFEISSICSVMLLLNFSLGFYPMYSVGCSCLQAS